MSQPSGNPPDTAAVPPKKRIVFIDMGRAIGALLVFYSHIAEQWVHRKGDSAPVIDFVDALTSVPMHMGKQGIGQIAVPMFFMISGFVVTPIALRQGQRRFVVNRLLRVYPPLIFAVLLTASMLSLGMQLLATGQDSHVTAGTILTNSLLVNYLVFPQVVLVGVAWTLVIEVIFYVLLVILLPVLRRWYWLALAIELTFVHVVLMTRGQFGNGWSLFAVNVSYLPIPILGQIIWAMYHRRINHWLGGFYLAAAWGLYVLADIVDVGRVDTSYNLALAVAALFFLLGLFAEPRLKERRIWTALSERSYSLYLLHGLVAFGLLAVLRPHVPLAIALVIAVAATFGVVELSYRLVEKPSHRLARLLSRRRPPAGGGPAPSAQPRSSSAEELAVEITTRIPRISPDDPVVIPVPVPLAAPSAQRPTSPPVVRAPGPPGVNGQPVNAHTVNAHMVNGQPVNGQPVNGRHPVSSQPTVRSDGRRNRHRADNGETTTVAALVAGHGRRPRLDDFRQDTPPEPAWPRHDPPA